MFAHYLGTTQFVARFVHKHFGTPYDEFYKGFMQFMIDCGHSSFLGGQLKSTQDALDGVLSCTAPWGRVVDSVRENFAWDFEEATVIDIMKNKKLFYSNQSAPKSKFIYFFWRLSRFLSLLVLAVEILAIYSIFYDIFRFPVQSLIKSDVLQYIITVSYTHLTLPTSDLV
mgnify:CR=1 FL=1